jgi:hypothetical protein
MAGTMAAPIPLAEEPYLVAMFREGLRRAGKTEAEIEQIEAQARGEIAAVRMNVEQLALVDDDEIEWGTQIEWPAMRNGRPGGWS